MCQEPDAYFLAVCMQSLVFRISLIRSVISLLSRRFEPYVSDRDHC